jgi:hypothetical protein
MLLRWFVGLPIGAATRHPTVLMHNSDQLRAADVVRKFAGRLTGLATVKWLVSSNHFWVDGTLIDASGRIKSIRPKDGSGETLGPGRNGERGFLKEHCSNESPLLIIDPDARLYRKARGESASYV